MIKIQVAKQFKKSVLAVIIAICLFIVLYILLIALSVALLIGCIYLAFAINKVNAGFFTLVIGVGLVALGIMFFIFLVKFVFSKHKDVNPYRIQIFSSDHPELFKIIKDISDQVGTQTPKKIFLRHDVNASVFYNSSFWSLFFPVKKNLEIGLGLINSLNQSELKAVLAHEFGHFSQRSMKLGSYVYTVNNVIYNLAYQYDSWDRFLVRWQNAGGFLGYFGLITSYLAEFVRFVLRKSYGLINKPYMSLSRQMEFHADHIAAAAAGKQNMISALRRLEFCEAAYNQTLNHLSHQAGKQIRSENLYLNHQYDIIRMCEYFKISVDHGLPVITDQDIALNNIKSRVIIKDQWASHPSREEREKNILSLNVPDATLAATSSWNVFSNHQKVQETITEKIYAVEYDNISEFKILNHEEYIKERENELQKFKIDDVFGGFYSNRFLHIADIELAAQQETSENFKTILKDLYSKKTTLKFEKLNGDEIDLQTLRLIKNKEIKTRYFEFDNKKYNRRDIEIPIKKLTTEIDQFKTELKEIEAMAVCCNLKLANEISSQAKEVLLNEYQNALSIQNIINHHTESVNEMNKYQYTVYNKTQWETDELKAFNRDLAKFEETYKNTLSGLNLAYIKTSSPDHFHSLQEYLSGNTMHTRIAAFSSEGFIKLQDLVFTTHEVLNESFLLQLKILTDIQADYYKQLCFDITA